MEPLGSGEYEARHHEDAKFQSKVNEMLRRTDYVDVCAFQGKVRVYIAIEFDAFWFSDVMLFRSTFQHRWDVATLRPPRGAVKPCKNRNFVILY